MSELSLDDILGIMATPEPKARTVKPKASVKALPEHPIKKMPRGTVQWREREGRCQGGYNGRTGRCLSPTHMYLHGIPRCHIHMIEKVDQIIGSLTKQLESLNVEPIHDFCCGDPGDCNVKCNGRKL